jgi:hypothetical protein
MARKLLSLPPRMVMTMLKRWAGSRRLPFIAGSGADGVEIRRELFSAEELNRLPELAADIERRGLLVCYSAPEACLPLTARSTRISPTLCRKRKPLTPCG